MKNTVFFLSLLLLSLQNINAQEVPEKRTIEVLQKELERIEEEEKKILKEQVENINSLLDNGVVSEAEAKGLKIKAAEARTKKIEERQAVVLETIFYLERKADNPTAKKDGVEIFLDVDSYSKEQPGLIFKIPEGNVSTDTEVRPSSESLMMREPVQNIKNKKIRKPTTLDLVFATGLNNTVKDGVTWQDMEEYKDYLLYSSRFWEIGLALKTPLWRKNGMRLKYGVSLQTNELEPSGNRYFTEVDGQTLLQESSRNFCNSRFVVSNLVFPVHLEFGPTKRKYNSKGSYYSTSNKFKIGIGGYVGLNLGARNTLEYPFVVRRRVFRRVEYINDYNMNEQIYGLSGYIGFGAISLYGKYDLNTIFSNGAEDEQMVSVGIRVDL